MGPVVGVLGWMHVENLQPRKGNNSLEIQNTVLYHHFIPFPSVTAFYVVGPGCDKRIGFRRTGWPPLRTAPVQVLTFHRGQCYQIWPAYAQHGIVSSRVFKSSTDASVFEGFVEQLLRHCETRLGPNSVLVMDNASFHHSDRTEQICAEAGVS